MGDPASNFFMMSLTGYSSEIAQTFTGDGKYLTSNKFCVGTQIDPDTPPTPIGTCRAKVYALEFGAPTGDPIAVSDDINMDNIPTVEWQWDEALQHNIAIGTLIQFTFPAGQRQKLENGTDYAVSIEGNVTSPYAEFFIVIGNTDTVGAYFVNLGFWGYIPNYSVWFYAYGVE